MACRSEALIGIAFGVQVRGLKDTIGFNAAAIRHLHRSLKTSSAVMGEDEGPAARPVKRRRLEATEEIAA